MANKQRSKNLVRVSGADALRRETTKLAKAGFFPVPMPSDFGYHSSGDGKVGGTFEEFIHSKLMCNDKGGGLKFPTLHLSSGGEIPVDNVGTEGLGYMAWGQSNNNPNIITLLTEASPYTASAHRFNTDLCEGRGPQAMYAYTQYVGGNITAKRIPYKDAGVLIKGWIRDLRRELKSEQKENDPTILTSLGTPVGDSDLAKDLKEQIAALEKDYEVWKQTNEELNIFLQRNNLHLVFLSLTEDMQQHNICFPELTLNKNQLDDKGKKVPTKLWTPKITGIRYRDCHQCRLERKDKNGKINYVYISNQWIDSRLTGNAMPEEKIDTTIAAIPALNPQFPVSDLQRIIRDTRKADDSIRKRPTRFILPVVYPSSGRPYYPVPANQSIYSGDIYEYLMTMISDRKKRRDNSNVIGRIIYLNQEYMERLYFQHQADTHDAKTKVFNELRNQINSFLQDRDNMGKPLVAYTFQGSDGKTYESWKIVEIESADKGSVEANQKELAEVSSIIFFAFGLDSRLVGNTPGDVSSHGGTDLRERFLLKQVQMSPMQELMLTPLQVVARFNQWDQHLEWEIQREVLTTLDNSKTGITTQPQE